MWRFFEETDEVLPNAQRDMDFGAGIPSGFSLTRSGAALGRDSNGRWVSFAANIHRTWYDPVTKSGPFMLVEPERIQYLYRTRQPTLTPVQATVAYDSAVQTPFGVGANTVIPNNVSATHGWNLFYSNVNHGASIPDNTPIAIRAVMKPKGVYTNVSFFLLNKTGVYSSVRFSMEGNGTVSAESGLIFAEIRVDTDGFYSLEMVNNYGVGASIPSCNINFHDSAGNRAFIGDGTSGAWLAYIGAEAGTEVSSPIINTGITSVLRPADNLVSVPSWITQGAKTIGVDYIALAQASRAVVDVSGVDVLRLLTGSNTVQFDAFTAGTAVASISGTAPASRVRRTVVMVAGNNNYFLTQNGALVGADTLGPVPSIFNAMRIGALNDSSNSAPVLLRRIKYWDNALSLDAAKSYSMDLSQTGTAIVRPVVSIQPSLTVPPSDNVADLTVLLTGEPDGVTVSYRTVDGTAKAGVDYVGDTGSLIIDPGDISGTITIGLSTRGTASDKTFSVEITSASGASVGNAACQILLQRVVPIDAPVSTAINFGSTLPAGVTLTRPSAAWTRNSSGVWTQVAANGYRHHFTAPGISGLLIEPAAAEQRLFNSLDPGFVAVGGTKTSNTASQTPTGTNSIQFRETATTGEHSLSVTLTNSNSAMPSGEFTTSVMIRPVQERYIRLSVKGIDNITRAAHMDLTDDGTIATSDPTVLLFLERDPFNGNWYRIGLDTGQAVTANVSAQITLTVQDASQNISVAGNTANGFDLCHVQVEPTYGMSSPIVVSGAAAATTRAADSLLASGTWFQRATYSLGMRFIRQRSLPPIQRIWMARDSLNGTNGVYADAGVLKFDRPIAATAISTDLTGDGVRTVWTVGGVPSDQPVSLVMAIDGVLQPGNSYILSGDQLVFSEPPPRNSSVSLRGFIGTVSAAEFVATGSQTVWTLPAGATSGGAALLVAVDGVVQPVSSYAVSGNQLTFSQAPPLNSKIDVRVIGS